MKVEDLIIYHTKGATRPIFQNSFLVRFVRSEIESTLTLTLKVQTSVTWINGSRQLLPPKLSPISAQQHLTDQMHFSLALRRYASDPD